MSQAVAKRRPDAMAPIAERGLPQELQPLAASLNDLLARLDAALGAQRRFTADAAHELRTPLTALKLQLDLARRAADPAARAAAFDDLDAGMGRAAHLVDQLLTLARVEPESLAARTTDVDLVELAKEAIVARAPVAADKGVDLGLARAAPAHVRGEPASLAILMSNLIDNALRYTPSGGRVDVGIDGGMEPRVQRRGHGAGHSADERERVFDRFHRGDATAAAGSGLGLSIVRRIADAHHATLRLDTPPGGTGLLVEVRFPPRPALRVR
jgi:two-component system OmpR family sensor kinase